MKIKNNLYCIADKNNKPDFRFLFEDATDAKKKVKQIKNSTKGETLLVSKTKRDFFIDGVKKDLIDPVKRLQVKRGCWTGLKVKKMAMLDTIEPKHFFKKVVKAKNNGYAYSKQKHREEAFSATPLEMPAISNPLAKVNWQESFLTTKSFAVSLAFLVLAVAISVLGINYKASTQIAKQTQEGQTKNANKIVLLNEKINKSKELQQAGRFDQDLNQFVMATMKSFSSLKQDEYEKEVRRILAGSPMEKMTPYIVQQDRTVAAFLVGIGKKESNLGRRVPVLNGEDCFNYWGYRGVRPRMGSGGHTCFDSPEDAIFTVAGRIQELVQADIDTPQEMVIWKCGSACDQDSQTQVQKWISDVNLYFSKLKGNIEEKINEPKS